MRRWILLVLKIGIGLALVGLLVVGIFVAVARKEIESFEKFKSSPNGQMVRVRAADGTVIQSLGPSFGRWIPVGELPKDMKDAMVAVEDRRFYYHPGVDPIGITRSFYVRATSGKWSQGGSTITQQLARTVYLNNKREFGRKLREVILAMAMETKFSKDQILELYLNKVYFGGGAFGVDAASRKFFDHGAEKLSLAKIGDHRRIGEGSVQLLAHSRCQGCDWPRRRGDRSDARCGYDYRRTSRSGKAR